MCVCDMFVEVCTSRTMQNRHSSLPAKPTTTSSQRPRLQPRTSLPTTLDAHGTLPTNHAHSLSPTPSPTPTPTATATPSRSRQLSEIEEEEERKSETHPNTPTQPASKSHSRRGSDSSRSGVGGGGEGERERGSRRDRERGRGTPRGKTGDGRGGRRRLSATELDTAGIQKARSRESLLQVEQDGTQSRPESPSAVSYHEYSRSPSLTPHHGDTKLDSPRSERRNIISKLRNALGDPPEGDTAEKVQSSSQREREADLESSLDYPAQITAAVGVATEEEEEEEEGGAVNVYSPLDTILTAMENET